MKKFKATFTPWEGLFGSKDGEPEPVMVLGFGHTSAPYQVRYIFAVNIYHTLKGS